MREVAGYEGVMEIPLKDVRRHLRQWRAGLVTGGASLVSGSEMISWWASEIAWMAPASVEPQERCFQSLSGRGPVEAAEVVLAA